MISLPVEYIILHDSQFKKVESLEVPVPTASVFIL
jgi:hypothetical protein